MKGWRGIFPFRCSFFTHRSFGSIRPVYSIHLYAALFMFCGASIFRPFSWISYLRPLFTCMITTKCECVQIYCAVFRCPAKQKTWATQWVGSQIVNVDRMPMYVDTNAFITFNILIVDKNLRWMRWTLTRLQPFCGWKQRVHSLRLICSTLFAMEIFGKYARRECECRCGYCHQSETTIMETWTKHHKLNVVAIPMALPCAFRGFARPKFSVDFMNRQ